VIQELSRHVEITLLWFISFAASLTVIGARIGYTLFNVKHAPPEDPELFAHWRRKRTWLIVSELSAVPAFATAGVVATIYWDLSPIASVLTAMILGALGFSFLLHALETLVRRRLDMKDD
jgi:hypothetical protein